MHNYYYDKGITTPISDYVCVKVKSLIMIDSLLHTLMTKRWQNNLENILLSFRVLISFIMHLKIRS